MGALSLVCVLRRFRGVTPAHSRVINVFSIKCAMGRMRGTVSGLVDGRCIICLGEDGGCLHLGRASKISVQRGVGSAVTTRGKGISIESALGGTGFSDYMCPSQCGSRQRVAQCFAFSFVSTARVTTSAS